MRRRTRSRQVLKWFYSAMFLVTLMLWEWSHGPGIIYCHQEFGASALAGVFYLWAGDRSPDHGRGLSYNTARNMVDQPWPKIGRDTKGEIVGCVPFWMIASGFGVVASYAWWMNRRFPTAHCQKCDYNLTGNVSGACPECGTKIESPTSKEMGHPD